MLSILKLDSILLTLLSTVIRVSFPLSLSQKGICSSIVYHKTLHLLYYKFPYYEKRTHNLLRCHCHSNYIFSKLFIFPHPSKQECVSATKFRINNLFVSSIFISSKDFNQSEFITVLLLLLELHKTPGMYLVLPLLFLS